MAVDIKTFNEKGVSPAKYYNKTSDIIEFLSSEKKAFTFDEVSIATNVDISNKKAVHNFTCLLNNAFRKGSIDIKMINGVKHIAATIGRA